SNIGTVGRKRMAGNDPLLRDMPEIQATAIMRSIELLNEPVEGFPGLTWFRPGHRSLLHRNLRVWSHPSRKNVLLMEPLPTSLSHLGWSEIAIGDDPDGLAIYYRGWIALSISESKMERCLPSSCGDSINGLSLGGLPLEV
ncbi:MAG: hypothetical protein EBY29_15875, partial [Planctomycetes bacterium]|nr:hypothetical protein [Planctomycetota bacterium]